MRVVPEASGPEAELARLARPTGPWIHLLDAAPADGRQLGWLLGQGGVVVRQLRGHCGRSTYGLLDEVGAALQLPGDPVEDWAGLAALLTDMAWLPGAGHVLVVSRAGLLLAAEPPAELAGLVGAVRAVARARAEEGDPIPFHLVLQDDTLGLATLRARLDAAGARYAELSGWDAEEPSAGAAVSTRSTLSGGPVDDVDLAAGTAVSGVEGVKELRRAWESFHGGCGAAVRVYVPMLGGPVDLVAVAGSLAAAVATAGAGCVVVPVPCDPALADRRQAAVTAVATAVWPEPVAVTEPVVAEVVETVTAAEPLVPAPEPEPAPVTSEPAPVPPEPPVPPQPPPVPPEPTPVKPEAAPVKPEAAPVMPEPTPVKSEPAPVPPEPAEVPHDRPGEPFELIAANLQWPFDTGPQEHDAVDTALLAHARTSSRTAGLFRTWVEDPAGGWVRVVLGYVNRTSIADVESERTAVVEILQKSGAARCCVEVLAAADVTEAHRWLEARCRHLWPDPNRPADAPPRPTGSEPADRPDPAAAAESGVAEDAVFRAGPGVGDPSHGPVLARLVEWAGQQDGVVALVAAFTADDRLVVGVALDGEADPARIRAAAPEPVEPFVPARGLAPVHLRLSRSSTRIWTRRTARPQPEPAKPTGLAVPAAPQVVYQGPPPTRDTDDPRGDTVLDGFTLVGIDRDTAVGKGDPQPDGQDTALVEFAQALPGAVALLRAVTEEQLKVYCLAVEDTVDPQDARRRLATAAAGAGLARAALEAFAPAGAISAFHLDLAVGSTRLWPVKN